MDNDKKHKLPDKIQFDLNDTYLKSKMRFNKSLQLW
jgi:hypothetical protein